MATATKSRVAKVRQDEAIASVTGLDPENLANAFTKTQLEVNQGFADMAARANERINTLRNLDIAIDAKREELKRLHDLDAAATELETVRQQIQFQREAAAENDEKIQLERDLAQADWEKQINRQKSDYEYTETQRRKRIEDEFNLKMQAQERDLGQKKLGL